jgi:uncharacterized FlgJ-related protein
LKTLQHASNKSQRHLLKTLKQFIIKKRFQELINISKDNFRLKKICTKGNKKKHTSNTVNVYSEKENHSINEAI